MKKMSSDKRTYGIIMAVFGAIALGVGIYVLICMIKNVENAFIKYFAIAAILCPLSVVGFLMPMVANSERRYAGDQSKDNVVYLVAILMFILGLLSILFCYMGIFNL